MVRTKFIPNKMIKKRNNVVQSGLVKKKIRGVAVRDARLKIIARNRSKVTDAREKLALLAKKMDAREKLEKIRNYRQGKLEVRKQGGITITKNVNGSIVLTTAKKEALAKTKNKKAGIAVARKRPPPLKVTQQDSTGRAATAINNRALLSEKDLLDDELMRTRAKPIILKRTIRQDVRSLSPQRSRSLTDNYQNIRPPLYTSYRASRSPSPMDYRPSRSRYDYDDPSTRSGEDDIYRRRIEHLQNTSTAYEGRTLADSVSQSGGSFSSPLQGTKIIVSNLQPTVTQEDIVELFGDVGALKRAKVTSPGSAEVVFVKLADALKAVEVYHNRQLDSKAMKCHIVGSSEYSNASKAAGASISFPKSVSTRRDAPPPDMQVVHKALFSDRRRSSGQGHGSSSSKPHFTITVAKKGY